MRTLRVYGDSYAAPLDNCWASILSTKLNLPVVNKAISGGSTEFAFFNLVEDMNNNTIGDDDVIIFVGSTPGRLYLNFQRQRPETASLYLREPPNANHDHSWYWANKKYIDWYLANQDHRIHEMQQEAYMHMIKTYAESKPNCTFIIMCNSDLNVAMPDVALPANFLRSYTYLTTVSSNEMIGITENHYSEWTSVSIYDVRSNHLGNPNLRILADLLEQSIRTKSIANITYDKFKQNYLHKILSKQQYKEDCSMGLYPFSNWFYEQIKL